MNSARFRQPTRKASTLSAASSKTLMKTIGSLIAPACAQPLNVSMKLTTTVTGSALRWGFPTSHPRFRYPP
ncbi:Uncharacterised protein [Mycobacteroides abscessus subsp. abscessus]|nr:Uncharacterised protein [Mycobacteroides abscessus subsp. abscessus]